MAGERARRIRHRPEFDATRILVHPSPFSPVGRGRGGGFPIDSGKFFARAHGVQSASSRLVLAIFDVKFAQDDANDAVDDDDDDSR